MLIPGHGAHLYQWRVPTPLLVLAALLVLGMLGAGAWALSHAALARLERARLAELRQNNLRVARDLQGGRQALLRVARLETELRRMLKFKTEKALVKGQLAGAPTDEDIEKLTELLEKSSEAATQEVEREMVGLVQAAHERERKFEQIRRYVRRKSSLLAARPTAWPVRGWIASGYGDRNNPVTGQKGFHMGIDIANDLNTPVRSAADGTVSFAGWEGGYGKLVIVTHGHGFQTYYGHLAELKVAVGQPVKRGTLLGLMGATGNVTGPHLHFEVRVYGGAVDPLKYLDRD